MRNAHNTVIQLSFPPPHTPEMFFKCLITFNLCGKTCELRGKKKKKGFILIN